MPKFALDVKAQLQGVSSFSVPPDFADDYPWRISLLCGSCGERSQKPVVLSRGDEVEGIRGAAVSMKVKCKLCDRVNDITILQSVPSTYTSDDSPAWRRFLEIEVRGTEPVAIDLSNTMPLSVKGENGFEAEDAYIQDGEFYGFDEDLNKEMVITEYESRVLKV